MLCFTMRLTPTVHHILCCDTVPYDEINAYGTVELSKGNKIAYSNFGAFAVRLYKGRSGVIFCI